MVAAVGKEPAEKPGPKRKGFTREQIDDAKAKVGRMVYPSRVADELRQKYGLSLNRSYALIDAARREAVDALAGKSGTDPLVLLGMFLESVMGDEAVRMRDRVAAASVYAKTLGLHRLAEKLQDADRVDEFLAAVLARRQARQDSLNGESP